MTKNFTKHKFKIGQDVVKFRYYDESEKNLIEICFCKIVSLYISKDGIEYRCSNNYSNSSEDEIYTVEEALDKISKHFKIKYQISSNSKPK